MPQVQNISMTFSHAAGVTVTLDRQAAMAEASRFFLDVLKQLGAKEA
jgi:hypothetical protein